MKALFLLSILFGIATCFQAPPAPIARVAPCSVAGGGGDYITLDTLHALNGAMETRGVSTIGSGFVDVSLAIAFVLISSSLLGIALGDASDVDKEETGSGNVVDSTNEIQEATQKETALNAFAKEHEKITAIEKKMPKVGEMPKAEISEEEPVEALKQEPATALKSDDHVAEKSTLKSILEETKKETAIEHVLELFFADDDITREEGKIWKAFDANNREELASSMQRILEIARTARIDLMGEREKRKQLQDALTRANDDLVQMQSQLALEQNKLVYTTQELGEAKAFLAATQEHLVKVMEENNELIEEKNRWRNLGRVAWNYSKAPIKQVLRKKFVEE